MSSQPYQLIALHPIKRIVQYEQSPPAVRDEGCKGHVDLAASACAERLGRLADAVRSSQHETEAITRVGVAWIG